MVKVNLTYTNTASTSNIIYLVCQLVRKWEPLLVSPTLIFLCIVIICWHKSKPSISGPPTLSLSLAFVRFAEISVSFSVSDSHGDNGSSIFLSITQKKKKKKKSPSPSLILCKFLCFFTNIKSYFSSTRPFFPFHRAMKWLLGFKLEI